MMLHFVRLTLCLLPLALTAPTGEKLQVSAGPIVQTQHATVVGTSAGGVDSFKGIPFAQAPIGPLRLNHHSLLWLIWELSMLRGFLGHVLSS